MGTTTDTPSARAAYLGATAAELSAKTAADMLAAGVAPKALFRRRGEISLYADRLVLGGWSAGGDLVLRRGDIAGARSEFTELYGRFVGGLLNAGKPLIIDAGPVGELYLLVNRRELLEITDDRRWAKLVLAWLAEGS